LSQLLFNVSALLLNDTEFILFSVVAFKTLIFQQGSVTTHFRCGGIFSDSIIINFRLILTVKYFENWSVFDEVIRRTKCANFLVHPLHRCDFVNAFTTVYTWSDNDVILYAILAAAMLEVYYAATV